jgi:ABC-type branched-subunit amino acid transport system ATPase component
MTAFTLGRPLALELVGVSRYFGGLHAVEDVSLSVDQGTIHSVIGPNGAGKTTLFDVVCGVLPPSKGTVALGGIDVTGWRSDNIARSGLARTFQATRLFRRLSVVDNLVVAGWAARDRRAVDSHSVGSDRRKSLNEVRQDAVAMLDFVGLAGTADRNSGQLPYGQQRLVEIGRALMTQPRVLMMDEPAAGLSTREQPGLIKLVRAALERYGLTVVLIEHAMSVVMEISDRITVLDHGMKISEGTPDEVASSEAVIAAYLGVDDHSA